MDHFNKTGPASDEELLFLSGADAVTVERIESDDPGPEPVEDERGEDKRKPALKQIIKNRDIIMVSAEFEYGSKVIFKKIRCRHVNPDDGLRQLAREAKDQWDAMPKPGRPRKAEETEAA